jgi:hypothetical protein
MLYEFPLREERIMLSVNNEELYYIFLNLVITPYITKVFVFYVIFNML